MIDPRNLAMNGLWPGAVNPLTLIVGGTFIAEIIIEPVQPSMGGGYIRNTDLNKYKITIKIKFKKRVWSYSAIAGQTTAKVIAKLNKIYINKTDIKVNSVKVKE